MNLKYHHMNLCTDNVPRLADFYKKVFELKSIKDESHQLAGHDVTNRFEGVVDFLSDGAVEFHITRKDVNLGFQMKQFVNPLNHGHICFRTDDIDGFKKRLEELDIPYADYGKWAIAGWYQIFFNDPDGTVVEVHQTGK